jgi:hypothetical protein
MAQTLPTSQIPRPLTVKHRTITVRRQRGPPMPGPSLNE